ncbi:MAG: helix-turn-helix domain-containing protein [Caldivirga sp.]|uniref:helix-turn-helix domain-containing protein n=1 Tax=Caldivirga sp. TaxID=2080243 RepID=UPI003D123CE5
MVLMLKVMLHHYGDWTELTEKYPITVYNPYFIPLQGANINLEVFRINRRLSEVTKSFIDELKGKYGRIIKVVNIIPSAKFTDLIIYADYGFSVKSVFVDNRAFVVSSKYSDGLEHFTVMLTNNGMANEALRDISSRLKEKANVLLFTYKRINEVHANNSELTPIEHEVLVKAVERGYFDYPRKVNLADLARELNLSKATVDFHLRRAVKKIVNKYVNGTGA